MKRDESISQAAARWPSAGASSRRPARRRRRRPRADDQVAADRPGSTSRQNLQIFGKADPNVRKPTAIVNGDGHHRHRRRSAAGADRRLANDVAAAAPRKCERLRAAGAAQADRRDAADPGGARRTRSRSTGARSTRAIRPRRRATSSTTPAELRRPTCARSARPNASLKRQIEGELAWQPAAAPQGRAVRQRRRRGGRRRSSTRLEARRSGTEEYHVAEIFLSATPERAERSARQRAASIIQQIATGAAFAYARQFSEASTAAVGGDLGWVRLEQSARRAARGVAEDAGRAIAGPIEVSGRLFDPVPCRQAPGADRRPARCAAEPASS